MNSSKDFFVKPQTFDRMRELVFLAATLSLLGISCRRPGSIAPQGPVPGAFIEDGSEQDFKLESLLMDKWF